LIQKRRLHKKFFWKLAFFYSFGTTYIIFGRIYARFQFFLFAVCVKIAAKMANKITIIGLGLIGGSLGLALKKALGDIQITGVPRREETIDLALRMGAIDQGTTDYKQGVSDADFVFICTPINVILPIVNEIIPALKKGAIVSDVGSSKYQIVSEAEKAICKGTFFVGGHPMAGKETTKIEAAEADLFQNKKWLFSKTSRTSLRAIEQLENLIKKIGAEPIVLDPKTHDLVVAAISHMPLAVAAALVNTIGGEEEKNLMLKCAASGFRDTTRIASGDPILGVDMFKTNQKAVLKMIKAFKKALSSLEGMIKEGKGEELYQELEKAKKLRDSIFPAS
jgi:prephenate dehydrogenase